MMLLEILSFVLSFGSLLAIVGGVAYVIYAWSRRGRDDDDEPEEDPGLGTLRRIYFYGVSFAALMTLVAGVSLAVQSLLNVMFDGKALSTSSSALAWGLSLSIVGLPIWGFHWRYIARATASMPVERRSIVRKLYNYLTLGVSLGFLMAVSFEILKWAMRAGEFPEFSLASVIPWAMVWGYHWRIESEEGQSSVETRGIRRLYIYGAALIGGVMFCVGAGSIVDRLLQDGYAALFLVVVSTSDQVGLARESLRTDLSVAIVGGVMYWAHWLRFARSDRDSVLRWMFLLIASVVGAGAALGSGGTVLFTALSWLFGAATERASLHFEILPSALVILCIGGIAWGLFRRRMTLEARGEIAAPISRIYNHLLSALGLGALAGASFVIINTALTVLAYALSVSVRDEDAWRSSLALIVTLLLVGVPVWGRYWRILRLAAGRSPESEASALSHRVYIFAVMGIGALAFLGGGGGTLFVVLRDLLDAELSVNTLRDLTPTVGLTLTAVLFLPYHWGIYRADQAFLPESEPAEPRPVRKRVTVLVPDGGSELVISIQEALGYSIREGRWSDAEAFAPTLDDEEVKRVVGEVTGAGGSNVLLIPDGGGLRVVSYD